jgi:hypothetical protein
MCLTPLRLAAAAKPSCCPSARLVELVSRNARRAGPQSPAHQIDYFYPSQLANETAPVYGIHFKPVEPLSMRFTLSMTF